ncbi:phosphoadenylyl-sulfate reductase, partial [Rhodobaculum claviforme]|uniref:phosphoadenylyl-sulfate reductase n=1 Tax=Rhodobaculum claviforme TaxID=1549854 RepID=UPI00191281EB
MQPLVARAEALNAAVPSGIAPRLQAIRAAIPGPVVLTTAFGIESQLLTHFIARERLDIDLVTLDTGRLFPETLDVWAETEARYGVRIFALHPDRTELDALLARDGPMGFRQSVTARQHCCHVRKVLPLARALKGAGGWISGLRRDQSTARRDTRFAKVDPARGLIKVSPLFDWSEEDVVLHVRSLDIPYNRLLDAGFRSIGCQPCTRATRIGEDPRAGRWWWEDSTRECGLHTR